MNKFNLKIAFLSIILAFPLQCIAGVVPEQRLTIYSPEQPEWKRLWDSGRDHVKNGNFIDASRLYKIVFEKKPEVEQLRWEYSQVVYYLGDTALSSKLLSELLDKSDVGQDVLLFAARVAFAEGHYSESSKYYQLVYDKSPYNDVGLEALKGLVVSLLKENRGEEALPLMRQLTLRTKNDMAIVKELALLTSSLGLLEESENYYQELLSKNLISGEEALEASQFFEEKEKFSNLDRTLKEEYLESFSGDLLVRSKLGDSYLQAGLQEKAVVHLEILAESGETIQWLRAARIYEFSMNRPDRALYCYEQYLQIYPGNSYVIAKIDSLKKEMANELLILAQNISPEILWQDLHQLIASPEEIYFNMVELAKNNKNKELAIQLLEIIELHSKKFDPVEFAEIYKSLGAYEKSLNLMMQIDSSSRDVIYYKKRAELERLLNYPVLEYQSRLELFFLEPDKKEEIPYFIDRIQKYGFINDLEKLLQRDSVKETVESDFHLTNKIITLYADAGRFNEAFFFLDAFAALEKSQTISRKREIQLVKAELLGLRGFSFEAEQIYRKLLTEDELRETRILYEIVELQLQFHKPKEAQLWHDEFLEKRDRYTLEAIDRDILVLIQAKIYFHQKFYSMTEFLLKNVLKKYQEKIEYGEFVHTETIELLSDSLFQQEKFTECYNLLKKHNKSSAVYHLVAETVKGHNISHEESLTIIKYFIKKGNFQQAQVFIDSFVEKFPQSYVAQKFYADILRGVGEHHNSLAIYQNLFNNSDKSEGYYFFRIVELLTILEKNDQELELLYNDSQNIKIIHQVPFQNDLALRTSRALWRAGEKEESLSLYLKTLDALGNNIEQIASIENQELESKGYWSEITSIFYPEKPIRDKVMSPGFLLTFHETEEAEVINSLFSEYRWHRLFNREFQARNADYHKKLFLAEKNYRRLFEEEGSSEAMVDLATIYKRLRYYGKEAQVYQTVQETGVTAPELDESIKENEQQRKPQIAFEGTFSNKDGRDGAIDMLKYQYGASFWFMPDLNADVYVKYLRTTYEDDLFDKESNYLGVGGKYFFNDKTNISFSLGGEDLSGDSEIKLIGGTRIEHRLSDMFRSYFSFDQRRVDDTITAVEEQILAKDLEAGLALETDLGLEIGADYRYSFISDDNEIDRIHGWLFYNIFGDKTRLDFHYDFEYMYANEPNSSVPYWSPQDYRKHELSLYFEHQFDSSERESELKRYYSIEYSIGFEEDQNILYTGEFDIFLEMSDNFLLKGNVLYSRSDDYDEAGVQLLFVYRW